MVADPPRASCSNRAGGILDTGVSFLVSMGFATGGAAGGVGGLYEGRGGSSSRFLFHMGPPSWSKYEYAHDTAVPRIRGIHGKTQRKMLHSRVHFYSLP